MSALDQFNMSRSQAFDMLDARDDDGFVYDMDPEDMDEYIDTVIPQYVGVTPESIRIHDITSMPRNAWLDPHGTLYAVGETEHANVAHEVFNDTTWGDGLEDQGWLHISVNAALYVSSRRPNITQAQMDTLWDIYMARPSDHPTFWQVSAISDLARLLQIVKE
jgi:hypothetical protein